MDGGSSALRRAMPDLRGTLTPKAPLAALSWFKTGGPAEVLYSPADEPDLAYFLSHLDPGIPVLTIGLGSNLLVRDGGFSGAVIQLGRPFAAMSADGSDISARRRGARCQARVERGPSGSRRLFVPCVEFRARWAAHYA